MLGNLYAVRFFFSFKRFEHKDTDEISDFRFRNILEFVEFLVFFSFKRFKRLNSISYFKNILEF